MFMGGFGYHVPVALPGGIKPVTWKATFSSDRPGVSLEWQWSAAVYTSFDAPGLLGVKPVDDPKASAYKNSDRAGTPESFKRFVTAGAAGAGGTDYTGHATPPTLVRPCV